MHLFLWAEDSEAEFQAELAQAFPGAPARVVAPALLETDFDFLPDRRLPHLVFARQWLPQARPIRAESIRAWASVVGAEVVGRLAEDQPWSLHIEPHYGGQAVHRIGARAWHSVTRANLKRRGDRGELDKSCRLQVAGCRLASDAGAEPATFNLQPATSSPRQGDPAWTGGRVEPDAGQHRARLVRDAVLELLQRKRRHLLRQLRSKPGPFAEPESLVQLLLTAPDAGFISVALAPAPFIQRHLLWPFPKGAVPIAADPRAPSRAFAKLAEAELRLGRAIRPGETCVDLGAAPGSWTYTAVNRGARVIAVDRSPLRQDLLASPHVAFEPGDAFQFRPRRLVDWLLCDLLAPPERTAELLLEWLRRGWCRHFVVTLKLKDTPGAEALASLKRELPPLTSECFLTRLCANKKEACAFGTRSSEG